MRQKCPFRQYYVENSYWLHRISGVIRVETDTEARLVLAKFLSLLFYETPRRYR